MNKMMLPSAANTARPGTTDLLSQLNSTRSPQEGDASASFAKLLQAKEGALATPPAPSPAPRQATASHAPSRPSASAAGPSGAADQARASSNELARRQEAAKATGRRPAETQGKAGQAQASAQGQAAEGEVQDPVLAQVLRHLRREDEHAGLGLQTESTDGETDEAETADETAGEAALNAQAWSAQPAQDTRAPLPEATAAGAADDAALPEEALGRPARGARATASGGDDRGAGRGDLPTVAGAPGALPDELKSSRAEAGAGLALEALGHAGQGAEGQSKQPLTAAGQFAGLLQQAQAGAVQDKGSPGGVTGARYDVQAPVHDKGFAPEMAARLSLAAAEGVQQAQLHLNPADMGPVQVQIVLEGQQAQISFVAEQAETRSALEKSLPELAGALREQGLTLSGGGVFSQQQQAHSGQPGQADRDGSTAGGRWAAFGREASAEEPASLQQHAAAANSRSRGVLDLFA